MNEVEKLRGLLTTLRISLNLDDTEYGLSQQEKRKMAADIDAALSQPVEPAPAQDEREAPEVVAIPCCSKDGDWYIDALHPSRLGEHGYLAEGDELMTVAQHERIVAALTRPAQTEQPIYLYRRKGQDAFATCDEDRFEELSTHRLFETKLAYAAPQREQSGYLPPSLTELLQRYKRDLEFRTFPDNDEGDYQLRWTAKEIARVNAALSARGVEE